VLSWNLTGWYQLHQFSLDLPDPSKLSWRFPGRITGQTEVVGRRLVGADSTGVVYEWYGESGGQLKYYPLADDALWRSHRFQLEPLPDLEHGLKAKAATYYPNQWKQVS
jgi:hypothetical protein